MIIDSNGGGRVNMHDLQPGKCPSCGQILQNTVCHNKPSERPRTGDPTVCFICGQILVFDESGRLRPIPDDVFARYAEPTKRALLRMQKTFRDRNAAVGGGGE